VHEFCETTQIPCLFPTTDLPVDNEQDFYTVYLDGGMAMQGGAVAQHLANDELLAGPVMQVFRDGDPAGMTAYPQMSLAPNQRFVSKGCYIAKLPNEGDGGLLAVSGWLIPGSK